MEQELKGFTAYPNSMKVMPEAVSSVTASDRSVVPTAWVWSSHDPFQVFDGYNTVNGYFTEVNTAIMRVVQELVDADRILINKSGVTPKQILGCYGRDASIDPENYEFAKHDAVFGAERGFGQVFDGVESEYDWCIDGTATAMETARTIEECKVTVYTPTFSGVSYKVVMLEGPEGRHELGELFKWRELEHKCTHQADSAVIQCVLFRDTLDIGGINDLRLVYDVHGEMYLHATANDIRICGGYQLMSYTGAARHTPTRLGMKVKYEDFIRYTGYFIQIATETLEWAVHDMVIAARISNSKQDQNCIVAEAHIDDIRNIPSIQLRALSN